MKRAALIFLAAGLTPLLAQTVKPKTLPVDPATAFAIAAPDENSPFFMDSANAERTRSVDFSGREAADSVAVYPKSRTSPDSAGAQIKGFFTNMFSSVNFGPLHKASTTEDLKIDPAKFSLQDRREVNVTYTIRNNTKTISRLEYPTTQRIDILTYDSKGLVIDRWSDDRAFRPEEGIVIINPKERIEYQEKIPTREMKPGESYRVETFTTSAEKFQSSKTITPE